MNFIKKIFGVNKTAAEKAFQNRAPRVILTPLHRLSFRPDGSEQQLELSNISTGGMAVLHQGHGAFHPNSDARGLLIVDNEEFRIEARIRHLTDALAGCEFLNGSVELKRAIEQYLRVEILALSLRKVDEAYLKPDPRGRVQWFTDGRQNEMFCVTDASDQVVAFHLSFFGNYVEGEKDRGVRAGNVEDKESDRPGHKSSSLLNLNAVVSREIFVLGKVFVENVDRLDKDLRTQISNQINQSL